MARYASNVVNQAKAWIGKKESDGSHKSIIDIYNAHKPLARNYKVKYTDAWCATTVSAVAIKLGYTDIIPTECSCQKMISLFKDINAWKENENCTPEAGWIIFYDWQDSGTGDNKGWSDHVGIVEKVSGNKITVIEGNYSNAVKRRTLSVNGKYIRGYGVPKYDEEKAVEPTVEAKKYSGTFPALPVRGYYKFGDGYKTLTNYTTQIKRVQMLLNWIMDADIVVDGDFGSKTEALCKKFQKKYGLVVDGKFGKKSLAKAKTITK